MDKMYLKIKRQNGEAFARAIKHYDERIFEMKNLPEIVRFAGRNALPILKLLRSMALSEEGLLKKTDLDPFALLKKAGYDAYLADTLKKQNAIRKYFIDLEELCTFRDSSRFEEYYIINAVKCGADKLNRFDFKGKEDREDEYGTSVISIQVLKRGGFIKICNRYNHTVSNPDNTFNSNPDEIIPGLSYAIKRYFNVDFSVQPESIPHGFVMFKGMILKYHTEKYGIYFGDNFVLEGKKLYPIHKDYQISFAHYVLDMKEKSVFCPFADELENILNDEMRQKSVSKKIKDGKIHILLDGKEFLTLNENKQIEEVTLYRTKAIKMGMFNYPSLRVFRGYELTHVARRCFSGTKLEVLEAPKLTVIESDSFNMGLGMDKLYLPNLKYVGNFVFSRIDAKEVHLPRLKTVLENVFYGCENLETVVLDSVVEVGWNSIAGNKKLKNVHLPRCRKIGYQSLSYNDGLEMLCLPMLQHAGHRAIVHNPNLISILTPRLKTLSDRAISYNKMGGYLYAPNLYRVDGYAFHLLWHVYAPYLRMDDCVLGSAHRRLLKSRQFIKKEERWRNLFGLLNYIRRKERGR